MRIYFSGIGGVGIGPLAMIAQDMGHDVVGSDLNQSRYTDLVEQRGLKVFIGQDGSQIKQAHEEGPLDWLVVTSALPADHPEIEFAKANGIRVSKRDELINSLIKDQGLKLIAVGGTHGKTTTTGMLIWIFKQLNIPISYSIGTDITFGPSGAFAQDSEYFIYEADEYDRNFLQFEPYVSIIPSFDYDHPDIYPTEADYQQAFAQFINSSHCVYLWKSDAEKIGALKHGCVHAYGADEDVSNIELKGEHNRRNAFLAIKAMSQLLPEVSPSQLMAEVAKFPGTGRRFEALAENIYSDYAHHPAEIKATIEQAKELSKRVVVVYQPHQNSRQHKIKDDYAQAFLGAEKVYWLPTYLSREDKTLKTLSPEELAAYLPDSVETEISDLNDELKAAILDQAKSGALVLLMSAGTLDQWARDNLKK